jgi:hypothetical protein
VDLNGDGHGDLLTGCFEGGLYLIAGLAEGGFAKPVAVRDATGETLRLGQYWCYEDRQWKNSESPLGISGHAVDFDDDGDLDLLLGSNDGHLYFRENLGSATEPEFSLENIQLTAVQGDQATPLFTGDGHAMPIAFDWDQDGLFDVLTGSNRNGVLWARNAGTKGSPAFRQLEVLIEPDQQDAGGVPLGTRLQVAAGDFDSDGRPEIFVGDYNDVLVEEDRTAEQEAEFVALRSDVTKTIVANRKLEHEIRSLQEAGGETTDELQELEAKLASGQARYTELISRYRELAPQRKRVGYVWLFRQKQAVANVDDGSHGQK